MATVLTKENHKYMPPVEVITVRNLYNDEENEHRIWSTCIFCNEYIRTKRICKNTGKKCNIFYTCDSFKKFGDKN